MDGGTTPCAHQCARSLTCQEVSGDPYVYPGTSVLKNRFGLRDPNALDRIERLHTGNRILEPFPRGSFDLTHLRAIHRHLFQDIYEWAG